jgi:hypothetical protein
MFNATCYLTPVQDAHISYIFGFPKRLKMLPTICYLFRMRTSASRQRVFPRRGVLASYLPVGCPDPPALADGRLVNLTKNQAR